MEAPQSVLRGSTIAVVTQAGPSHGTKCDSDLPRSLCFDLLPQKVSAMLLQQSSGRLYCLRVGISLADELIIPGGQCALGLLGRLELFLQRGNPLFTRMPPVLRLLQGFLEIIALSPQIHVLVCQQLKPIHLVKAGFVPCASTE